MTGAEKQQRDDRDQAEEPTIREVPGLGARTPDHPGPPRQPTEPMAPDKPEPKEDSMTTRTAQEQAADSPSPYAQRFERWVEDETEEE